jgi:hypothetical protein
MEGATKERKQKRKEQERTTVGRLVNARRQASIYDKHNPMFIDLLRL